MPAGWRPFPAACRDPLRLQLSGPRLDVQARGGGAVRGRRPSRPAAGSAVPAARGGWRRTGRWDRGGSAAGDRCAGGRPGAAGQTTWRRCSGSTWPCRPSLAGLPRSRRSGKVAERRRLRPSGLPRPGRRRARSLVPSRVRPGVPDLRRLAPRPPLTSERLDRLPRRWAPSRSRPDGRLARRRMGARSRRLPPGQRRPLAARPRCARPVRRAGAQAVQGIRRPCGAGGAERGDVQGSASARECPLPSSGWLCGTGRIGRGRRAPLRARPRRRRRSGSVHHQGDLRQRRRRGGAEHRRADVVMADGAALPTPVNCSGLATVISPGWPERFRSRGRSAPHCIRRGYGKRPAVAR